MSQTTRAASYPSLHSAKSCHDFTVALNLYLPFTMYNSEQKDSFPDLEDMQIGLNLNCYWNDAGPSCSKLTTSLVNDSFKFKSSDTQIC